MRNSRTLNPTADHVAGSMQEAAVRSYYERGSKEAVERNLWKIAALTNMVVAGLAVAATVVMAVRAEVHVFQVTKSDVGELVVQAAASKFTPDEDTKMAWGSRWLSELTEISPAMWQRNIKIMQSKVAGVGADQAKAYLGKLDNNPAALTSKFPTYVREYERRSVNKVSENTYLVRYDLVSRPAPGVPAERRTFAATINLAIVGHQSQDDVFRNPEGLAITNFSISEETK